MARDLVDFCEKDGVTFSDGAGARTAHRTSREFCRRKAAEREREVEGSEMASRRTLYISHKQIPAYTVERQAMSPGA